MRLVKLCFRDNNIFGAHLRPDRLSFLYNCLDAFMIMYKQQGTTFWLRLLISFKYHIEDCIEDIKSSDCYPEAIKILNSLYINIHKKFIEGNETNVLKFIRNLLTATLNLNNVYALVAKEEVFVPLREVFLNIYCLPDPSIDTSGGIIMFISLIYCNFLTILSFVFSEWEIEHDLTQKEVSEIDKKVFYWIPPMSLAPEVPFMCFDRYICDYWKEFFPKMVCPKSVQKYYNSHPYSDCCKHAAKGNILSGIDENKIDSISSALYNIYDNKIKNTAFTNGFETVTRKNMKYICFITPVAVTCKSHENCWMRIKHDGSCLDPYLCSGAAPCIKLCDHALDSEKKEVSAEKLWDNMSVETFPPINNKRDVSTMVATDDKTLETYVSQIFPCSSSNRDCPSPDFCMSFHNCQYNPRKEECLSRLRKKFRQKHFPNDIDLDLHSLQDPISQEFVIQVLDCRMKIAQDEFCANNKDIICDTIGDCFWRTACTVAVGSHHAFGLVVSITKIRILVPRNVTVKKITSKKYDSSGCSVSIQTHMIASEFNTVDEFADNILKEETAFEKKKKEPSDITGAKVKTNSKKQKTSEKSSGNVNISREMSTDERKVANSLEKDIICHKNSDTFDKQEEKVTEKDKSKENSVKQIASIDKENHEKLIYTPKENTSQSHGKQVSNESQKCDVLGMPEEKYISCVTSKSSADEEEFKNSDINIGHEQNAFSDQNIRNAVTSSLEWDPEVEAEIERILKVLGIQVQSKSPSKESVCEEKIMETFFEIMGIDLQEDTETVNSGKNISKLKSCAFCKKIEPKKKTYKRCKQCKQDNFPEHRYYCSRECQIEDWVQNHETEHEKF